LFYGYLIYKILTFSLFTILGSFKRYRFKSCSLRGIVAPHLNGKLMKVVYMPEPQVINKPAPLLGFLKQALNSVEAGIEDIKGKGVGVRLDADYCNSIVNALSERKEFEGFSDTELKLALKPLFKAVVLNTVAKELGIIEQ